MDTLCTYCSKKKSSLPGDIPAIRRYESDRIQNIYQASTLMCIGFFILSGQFGLIPPEFPIPDYNHKLEHEEVEVIVDKIVGQIHDHDISSAVYVTEPINLDANLKPYHAAFALAFTRARRPFMVVEMRLQSGK